jgi:hypothetical protein
MASSGNPPPSLRRLRAGRQLLQRLRILEQQRQISGTAADGFEQVEDARQRLVRVRRRRAGVDDQRHQRVETAARRFRHLLVAAAGMDRRKTRRGRRAVTVALGGESGGGFALTILVTRADAAVPDAAVGVAILVRIGKHLFEMPGDGDAMVVELGEQRFVAWHSPWPRDDRLVFGVAGRLWVCAHLRDIAGDAPGGAGNS